MLLCALGKILKNPLRARARTVTTDTAGASIPVAQTLLFVLQCCYIGHLSPAIIHSPDGLQYVAERFYSRKRRCAFQSVGPFCCFLVYGYEVKHE